LLAAKHLPDWTFVGIDIDEAVLHCAKMNICDNPDISDRISLLFNPDKEHIFASVLKNLKAHLSQQPQSVTICNPPFYTDAIEAQHKRAGKKHRPSTIDNPIAVNEAFFSSGGEFEFICRMIQESKQVPITICTSLLGLLETKSKLERYLATNHPNISYYFESFRLSRTVRWVIFWSKEINFQAKNQVKCTIDDLAPYGQLALDKQQLILTHNTWNRTARRSGTSKPISPTLKINIKHSLNHTEFSLNEGDSKLFQSFVNHLSRKHE